MQQEQQRLQFTIAYVLYRCHDGQHIHLQQHSFSVRSFYLLNSPSVHESDPAPSHRYQTSHNSTDMIFLKNRLTIIHAVAVFFSKTVFSVDIQIDISANLRSKLPITSVNVLVRVGSFFSCIVHPPYCLVLHYSPCR